MQEAKWLPRRRFTRGGDDWRCRRTGREGRRTRFREEGQAGSHRGERGGCGRSGREDDTGDEIGDPCRDDGQEGAVKRSGDRAGGGRRRRRSRSGGGRGGSAGGRGGKESERTFRRTQVHEIAASKGTSSSSWPRRCLRGRDRGGAPRGRPRALGKPSGAGVAGVAVADERPRDGQRETSPSRTRLCGCLWVMP